MAATSGGPQGRTRTAPDSKRCAQGSSCASFVHKLLASKASRTGAFEQLRATAGDFTNACGGPFVSAQAGFSISMPTASDRANGRGQFSASRPRGAGPLRPARSDRCQERENSAGSSLSRAMGAGIKLARELRCKESLHCK